MKDETKLIGHPYVVKARDQVRAIQASMIEAAGPCFLETEFEDLRVVIRLTVEFYYLLQTEDMAALDPDERTYLGESVFGGVNSFASVSSACRAMDVPGKSALDWSLTSSLGSFMEQFISKYQEFSVETDLERRCRLLLDLFKMQIVFTGMSYE